MAIDQYDFIEIPGNAGIHRSSNIKIPVVRRPDIHDSDQGSVIPDWMFSIPDATTNSTIALFPDYSELFGWYCESSRHVTRDSSNNLYTSSTLWHSDVYIVFQNGVHNAYIKHAVSDGIITPKITIIRIVRTGQDAQILQTLEFQYCHWASVQSYLDWTIASFTPCIRSNKVIAFDQQKGQPEGFNMCETDYTQNTVGLESS